MVDWIPIRIRTEPGKMRHVQNVIKGFPDQVMEKYYFQFLQYVAATGADIGRNYIASRAVSTKTGESEGRQGRVKSGTMQKGFKWRGGKEGNQYKFVVGWVDGTPGYSIFQEQGTKNGVIGMDALGYVTEWMRDELKFYSNQAKGTKIRTATRWSGSRNN